MRKRHAILGMPEPAESGVERRVEVDEAPEATSSPQIVEDDSQQRPSSNVTSSAAQLEPEGNVSESLAIPEGEVRDSEMGPSEQEAHVNLNSDLEDTVAYGEDICIMPNSDLDETVAYDYEWGEAVGGVSDLFPEPQETQHALRRSDRKRRKPARFEGFVNY